MLFTTNDLHMLHKTRAFSDLLGKGCEEFQWTADRYYITLKNNTQINLEATQVTELFGN